jgi:hypothetical protein
MRHALLFCDRVAARRKYDIELFQGALLSLNDEEVDDRDKEEVEDGEEDVL